MAVFILAEAKNQPLLRIVSADGLTERPAFVLAKQPVKRNIHRQYVFGRLALVEKRLPFVQHGLLLVQAANELARFLFQNFFRLAAVIGHHGGSRSAPAASGYHLHNSGLRA